jgi:hypothetical protein
LSLLVQLHQQFDLAVVLLSPGLDASTPKLDAPLMPPRRNLDADLDATSTLLAFTSTLICM